MCRETQLRFVSEKERVYKRENTGVINDPHGQPTDQTFSDCRMILKFWDGQTNGQAYVRTYVRTICVKIVITTGVGRVDQKGKKAPFEKVI